MGQRKNVLKLRASYNSDTVRFGTCNIAGFEPHRFFLLEFEFNKNSTSLKNIKNFCPENIFSTAESNEHPVNNALRAFIKKRAEVRFL